PQRPRASGDRGGAKWDSTKPTTSCKGAGGGSSRGRVGGRVGSSPGGVQGQGEGRDRGARRPRCPAPPPAASADRAGLRAGGPGGRGELQRGLRRPTPAARLPLHVWPQPGRRL